MQIDVKLKKGKTATFDPNDFTSEYDSFLSQNAKIWGKDQQKYIMDNQSGFKDMPAEKRQAVFNWRNSIDPGNASKRSPVQKVFDVGRGAVADVAHGAVDVAKASTKAELNMMLPGVTSYPVVGKAITDKIDKIATPSEKFTDTKIKSPNADPISDFIGQQVGEVAQFALLDKLKIIPESKWFDKAGKVTPEVSAALGKVIKDPEKLDKVAAKLEGWGGRRLAEWVHGAKLGGGMAAAKGQPVGEVFKSAAMMGALGAVTGGLGEAHANIKAMNDLGPEAVSKAKELGLSGHDIDTFHNEFKAKVKAGLFPGKTVKEAWNNYVIQEESAAAKMKAADETAARGKFAKSLEAVKSKKVADAAAQVEAARVADEQRIKSRVNGPDILFDKKPIAPTAPTVQVPEAAAPVEVPAEPPTTIPDEIGYKSGETFFRTKDGERVGSIQYPSTMEKIAAERAAREAAATNNPEAATQAAEAAKPTITVRKGATAADTLTHEMNHDILERVLSGMDKDARANYEKQFGVKDGNWTPEAKERFAEEYREYDNGAIIKNPYKNALFSKVQKDIEAQNPKPPQAIGARAQFMRETVQPKIEGAKDAVHRAKAFFSPHSASPAAKDTGLSFRDASKQAERNQRVAEKAVNGLKAEETKYSQLEQEQAAYEYETNQQIKDPGLRAVYNKLGQIVTSWKQQLIKLDENNAEAFTIENYLPHLYKESAAEVRAALASFKRSFGKYPDWFEKRQIPTMRDAKALGLTPLYDSMTDMVLKRNEQIQKYIFGQSVLKEAVNEGWAVLKDPTGKWPPPPGWVAVKGYFPGVGRDVLWAEPDVARIFNNYQSEGLFANTPILHSAVTAMNQLKMAQVGVRLGLSLYHIFVSNNNDLSTGLALAIEKGTRGDVKGALGELARTPGRTITNVTSLGRRGLREYLNPGSDPENGFGEIVDNLVMGGMKTAKDSRYGGAKASFAEAWHETGKAFRGEQGHNPIKNAPRVVVNAPFAGVEAVFDNTVLPVVRTVKMGEGIRLMKDFMEKNSDALAKATSEEKVKMIRAESAKINDHLDNVFGLLDYDNMGLNKAFTDILHLFVQAPGWNIGNLRLILGASIDSGDFLRAKAVGLKSAVVEKDPSKFLHGGKVTQQMAFIPATVFVTALSSTIYQKVRAGKYPWETDTPLHDMYQPRNGQLNPDGSPSRDAVGTYIKDWIGWGTHPIKTAENKLAPAWNEITQQVHNKAYDQSQIADRNASMPKQILQRAGHAAGAANIPYAWANAYKDYKEGHLTAGNVIAPQMAFTRAPNQYSAAQTKLHDIDYQRSRTGGYSAAETLKMKANSEKFKKELSANHGLVFEIQPGTGITAPAPDVLYWNHGLKAKTMSDVFTVVAKMEPDEKKAAWSTAYWKYQNYRTTAGRRYDDVDNDDTLTADEQAAKKKDILAEVAKNDALIAKMWDDISGGTKK